MDATRHHPWNGAGDELAESFFTQMRCESIVVSVWDVRQPSADEVLYARGVKTPWVIRWCEQGFHQDPTFSPAMQHGHATANGDATSTNLPAHAGQTMVVMLPESLKRGRWWYLLLSRPEGAFSEREVTQAELVLRSWHVQFHRGEERDLGRVLLGRDDRLVLADVGTLGQLSHEPGWVDQLHRHFKPVLNQRFPDLADRVERDFAADIEGRPYWVRFQRRSVLKDTDARHWYLELRPLEEATLPTLGHLEDPRIARSVAYLHENYGQSPSLGDVASHVHMSPFHFHRLFSREVGVSPKQYLQRLQLQVARWMLRSTAMPIGDIALRTGFVSHGHFTSTFHRIVGQSPSDYRISSRAAVA